MTSSNEIKFKDKKSIRLLFVITEDWFFTSHFIERAVAAKHAGYDVAVATRVRLHAKQINDSGIEIFPIEFSRRGLNPITEIRTAWRLRHIVRKFAPDVIHNIALKPVVVGTLGERLAGHKRIVNAPVGMGYIFSSQDRRATLLRPVFLYILRRLLNPVGSEVIIENPDDYSSLIDQKMVRPDSLSLIKGAGVNTNLFTFVPEPAEPVVVTIVARMLRDKGIAEGVSNIFIENLNKLPLNQRPIHCTDPKRETIYIKNEQWEKDEDKLQTKEVIKKVSYLQVKNIKLYKEAHPQLMENQKEKDDYMEIIKATTDDVTEKEDKILKNICKSVYISNNLLE